MSRVPSENLAGQRFTRLYVVRYEGVIRGGHRWRCQCDCGSLVFPTSAHLLNERTKSCGCLSAESLRQWSCRKESRFPEQGFYVLLTNYKQNARRRGCDFDLSDDEFRRLTSSNCYYCGNPPALRQKSRGDRTCYVYNGIDRVDNAGGYTSDNARPCCSRCNFLKGPRNEEEFLELLRHATQILRHLGIAQP